MKRFLLALALLSIGGPPLAVYGHPIEALTSHVLRLTSQDSLPTSQSGLYVPSAKPVKDMKKALKNPEVFYLLLNYGKDQTEYSVSDLDLLDSAYRIAFDVENPKYYTMTVECFGTGSRFDELRVESVVRYFSMRCGSKFPIRYARNPIRCSCHGDSVETLRFEVPVMTAVYDCSELPTERKMLNKSIPLDNHVLVTFRNDPDECVGSARGCFMPSVDSVVHGYYASLFISRGAIYSVEGTKDTCPGGLHVTIDDHLDYKATVEQYKLIPHPKQLLVQAGYIVVHSNFGRQLDECEMEQKDSVFIRIPVTQEQIDAKLKFFAKVKTTRGVEYKAMPTRKLPGKGQLVLQAPISVDQFDTIYLGKRIKENELKQYFYEVDNPTEAASFAVGERFFVAYRVGKYGDYELRKGLKALFRISPDQEEDDSDQEKPSKIPSAEEIIED